MNVAEPAQKSPNKQLITNLNHLIKSRQPQYTYQEVYDASMEYFNQDTLASSTFADKYALKKTFNNGDRLYVEKTPQEMHERLSAELARAESYYKFDKSEVDAILNNASVHESCEIYAYWFTWYSEFLKYLENFNDIVPQGSPMSAMGNPYVLQSLSNCVVAPPPEDSWSSISKVGAATGHLYKARCGVGLDISNLRPENAAVNNAAGSSTGAWSFADYYSNTTRIIGQSGRRGATMITIHSIHPDVVEFIIMKRDPTKVTGANISLLIRDSLMRSIEKDEELVCYWPIDTPKEILDQALEKSEWKDFVKDIPRVPILDYNNHNNIIGFKEMKMDKISGKSGFAIVNGQKIYIKKYAARDVWFLINESAQLTAEPGVIFWDNYINNLPADCYEAFKTSSTNPCVVGETLVAVADGRGAVSFKDLSESGEDIPVYAKDDEGFITVRMMRAPRMTKSAAAIYKVMLSNGEHIKCTENHRFILRDDSSVEAKNLNPGDSLRILSRYDATSDQAGLAWMNTKQEYTWISGGKTKRRGEHRIISEFYSGIDLRHRKDLVVHHKDFNPKNNNISNLEIMNREHHDCYHGKMKQGENNPMFIALNGGWSEDRVNQYKLLQSQKSSKENNSRYCGVDNDKIREHAILLTANLGHKFSYNDWMKYATENKLPKGFSGWRKEALGGITSLSKWAALELGIENIDIDPRIQKTLKSLLSQGYDAFIAGGKCLVNKNCSICDRIFTTTSDKRATCLCSRHCGAVLASRQPGRLLKSINTKKIINSENADKQMRIYNDLSNELKRMPLLKEWESECSAQNVVHRVGKASGTFRSYKELENQASMFNHTVVSVEFMGYEDVYNGTVDDLHNYFIGGFEEKTNHNTRKQVFVNTQNCSEIALSPLDSCRLVSINLLGSVINSFTKKAKFDIEKFKIVVKTGMRIMDNVVDLEIEALDKIINKVQEQDEKDLWNGLKTAAINGRRTGLGTHALADCLAHMTIRYDSDNGNAAIDNIYKTFRNEAYRASIELAKERGAFPVFDWEKEKDNIFINRLPQDIIDDMKIYGRRNIALLTNAPTGSVAIESQTSSGIEPVFRFLFTRRKKINPGQENARVDFTDQNGDKWQEYPVFHHSVRHYFSTNKEASDKWDEIQNSVEPSAWPDALRALLPGYFVSSDQVDPMMRVRLQGTLQAYIDHGVSSTINLPKGTSVETIAKIYEESWKKGLKGVTVYVDGSRSGVLISSDKKTTGRNGNSIINTHAPKRPRELACDIHRSSVEGKYWTIFVGLLDGAPYEVFGGSSDSIEIPRRRENGKIIKRKATELDNSISNSVYDLITGEDDDDQLVIRNISKTFHNGDYAWATRLISQGLRHGINPEFIVQQLRRANDSSLTSFSKAIARVLAKYVNEENEIGSGSGEGTLGIICKSGSCE